MKLIKKVPELGEIPLTFCIERFDEVSAKDLLAKAIETADEVIGAVSGAYKEEWTNNPSTIVRAVFGHWLVKAGRHLAATITLCKEHDLSVVVDVHHRQIFELFLQVRYYASLHQDGKEKNAMKILAIGYVEFLEKMNLVKDDKHIQGVYKDTSELLSQVDKDLVEEIKNERGKRLFYWFGSSFSQLAKNVSRMGENLKAVYQIISADVHGSWNLALDVKHSKPGCLDFRGYPDKTTMYVRAAQKLYQVTNLYMNLWNEIAESVGAPKVYYFDQIFVK